MDENYPLEDVRSYIGKHKSQSPSPSLCISLPIVEENARIFYENVKAAGVEFRAHVKTNKTTEISRILLGDCGRVVVSTLREARGLRPLIADGTVTDLLYGIPFGPSMLPELDQLAKTVSVRLLIDNASHIEILSRFKRCPENASKPWSVFIKLDMGSQRAGLPLHSPALACLISAAEESPSVSIYGFYSYSSSASKGRCVEAAEKVLQAHIEGILTATKLLKDQNTPLVLSIGSSPTARVITPIREKARPNITFEIHAGTIIYNDLQQLATRTIDSASLGISVIAEICSVYPERNEALISAGVLALTREPSTDAFEGIARVRGKAGWCVGRVSQEHGILVSDGDGDHVEDVWAIGDKVELDVQHACIVSAMYGWQFITDAKGVVRDVYFPWKWW